MNPSKATITLFLFLLIATPAFALVDLANPANGFAVNNGTIMFEYYVSVPDLTTCSVNAGANSFIDPDVQNSALNTVEVQNIPDGAYLWNVTCEGSTTETSTSRSFVVDSIAPTLAIIAPVNGTIIPALTIDIIPADNNADALSCDVIWNTDLLETLTIASNTRTVKTYTVGSGTGTLRVACADAAHNAVTDQRTLTIQPPLHFTLTTDKPSYGPLESVRLTVDSLNGANVTVDICPNQTGFVQCSTALLGSNNYPQTFTLPYMNKTGQYLIEGIARLGNQTRVNTTTYTIENTLVVNVAKNATPKPNTPINLTASATGGIGPYRFNWILDNGTTIQNKTSVIVTYPGPDEYTERVTVYDKANNSRELVVTIDVRDISEVQVRIYDNVTGIGIDGASVTLGDEDATTFDSGLAYFNVPAGAYDVLVSSAGYRFAVDRYAINGSRQIAIGLARDLDTPQVTIQAPTEGLLTPSPVTIRAQVTHSLPSSCTLYLNEANSEWATANGTSALTGSGTAEYVRYLPAGSYQAKVECVDAQGHAGASAPVSFLISSINNEQPVAITSSDSELQAALEAFTAAVESLDQYGPQEREAMALTGFDKDLRNTRRAIQQAIRDLDSLQYRNDLDASAREAERTSILTKVREVVARTPKSLRIVDKQQWVRYADHDELAAAATAIAGKDGITTDVKMLTKLLTQDQQKFTTSSTLLQVEYIYGDGTTRTISVISRQFTYAPDVTEDYRIIEIIPKEIAAKAKDLDIQGESEILEDDPIISFKKADTITYLIPKKIDRDHAQQITTILARRYVATDAGFLTGFAFLGGIGFSTQWGWLVWLLIVLAIVYLAWYLDLVKQITYLIYRLGRNEKVHYLRVLLNDVDDQLAAGDYGKAELLYKEIRLTYDTLNTPARNDLYDELIATVHKMDTYYFNTMMIAMDACLKANDHEGAIAAYEKLLGTYERLDPTQQAQLVDTIAGLGRRLGLEVPM